MKDRVPLSFPGWSQTYTPPASGSGVAGTTGLCHHAQMGCFLQTEERARIEDGFNTKTHNRDPKSASWHPNVVDSCVLLAASPVCALGVAIAKQRWLHVQSKPSSKQPLNSISERTSPIPHTMSADVGCSLNSYMDRKLSHIQSDKIFPELTDCDFKVLS